MSLEPNPATHPNFLPNLILAGHQQSLQEAALELKSLGKKDIPAGILLGSSARFRGDQE